MATQAQPFIGSVWRKLAMPAVMSEAQIIIRQCDICTAGNSQSIVLQ
jgi:hypothetical protein